MALSIGSLVAATKVVDLEFPGIPDFVVSLNYISRDEMAKLREKATKTKFKAGTRDPIQELDADLFLKLYVSTAVKGWKGLTLSRLAQLMVLKDDIPSSKVDEEIPYTEENALDLVKNSKDFDIFVGESINDLTNFQSASIQIATKQ